MNSPPQRVSYEELPERPFNVNYDTTLTPENLDLSTPRRKTRITKERRTREHLYRKKKKVVSAGDSDGPGQSDAHDLVDSSFEIVSSLPDTTCTPTEEPLSKVDLMYAGFVDAVHSDECSFYQLSQRVFVANGWNLVREEPNVSANSRA